MLIVATGPNTDVTAIKVGFVLWEQIDSIEFDEMWSFVQNKGDAFLNLSRCTTLSLG